MPIENDAPQQTPWYSSKEFEAVLGFLARLGDTSALRTQAGLVAAPLSTRSAAGPSATSTAVLVLVLVLIPFPALVLVLDCSGPVTMQMVSNNATRRCNKGGRDRGRGVVQRT